MAEEDKISFAQFHDEIDNQSFMGRPSKSNSVVPHNDMSPYKSPGGSGHKGRAKSELRMSQSIAE